MADLKLIDCHVHCFPDKPGARDFMTRVVRRPEAARIGTIEQLREAIAHSGVHQTNILMYTPAALYYEDAVKAIPAGARDRKAAEEQARRDAVRRVEQNNDWCAGFVKKGRGLSFFCGVDPVLMTAQEMLAGIERWVAAGARGVKIVPASLRIFGDDPRLSPVYDYLQRRSIPLLAQSGGSPAPGQKLAFGHPAPFGTALRRFPRLKLIFAHMAHFPYLPDNGADELFALTSRYPGVCADLSLRLGAIADGAEPAEWVVSMVKKLGAEHILLGTNFPLADQAKSLEAFMCLPLAARQREAIAHGNFERLTSR